MIALPRAFLLLALYLPMAAQAEPPRLIAGMIPGFCEIRDRGIGGVSCALVAEMAHRVGYTKAIELMPQARAFGMARAGPMVLVPLSRNDSREAFFQWHIKLLEDDVVIVARQDSTLDISSVNAARELSAGILRGGSAFDFAERAGFAHLEALAEEKLNARKLAAGRIDAWIGLWNSIRRAQATENLPISSLRRGAILRQVEIHLAASLDVPATELARWKAALDSMKEDGAYRRILADYDYDLPP